MSIEIADRVCDYGLTVFASECDSIYICSAQPRSYDDAVSRYALGVKSTTPGVLFSYPVIADGGGRKVVSTAFRGDVLASGMATRWAAVDTNTQRLLAAGTLKNFFAVRTGQKFLMSNLEIIIRGGLQPPSVSSLPDAVPIAAGFPVIGSPSVGYTASILGVASLTAGLPVMQKPALFLHNILSELSLDISSPILSPAAIKQTHRMDPADLLTTPILGAATIRQKNALLSSSVLAGVPVQGTPTVAEGLNWSPTYLTTAPMVVLDGETVAWSGNNFTATNNTGSLGGTIDSIANTLWTPANLVTPPRYIFDPSTFTYSGNNFSSGNNGGSAGGAWTAESGTAAKGAQLNGVDVLEFTGTQGFLNSAAAWPSGSNVFVFTVAKVGTTHIGGLAAHTWDVADGRDGSHGWVYYPRGGNIFGGSVNEGFVFNGVDRTVITRGDIFNDANFHIATMKMGSTAGLRKDGTAGTPTLTTTGAVQLTPSSNMRIGSVAPGAGEPLTATVAYVAVLVDPTTDEIQKLEGWAAWRFGLVANLPAGHPYKSAAPASSAAGVPVKGSLLNGKNTIDLSANQALGIVGRNWPASNVSVFAVINPLHDSVTRGLASMGFYAATSGWVFYTSLSAFSLDGNAVNNNDYLFFGSGAASTQNRVVAAPPSTAPGWRLFFGKAGTENVVRTDGSAQTPSYSVTGSVAAMTNQRVNIGAGNAAGDVYEQFGGQIAYLLVLTNPTQADVERLEGWAAWRFGLTASLPAQHPYKNAPPRYATGQQGAASLVAGSPVLGAPSLSSAGQPSGALLTWAKIRDDNGADAAARPYQTWYVGQTQAYRQPINGQYPYAYGLPINYSWFLGGVSFLGSLEVEIKNIYNELTTWFLVYPEAYPYPGSPGLGSVAGNAKPNVACNVWVRGVKTFLHRKTGGWITGQTSESSLIIPTNYTADQRAASGAYPVTTTNDPDGIYPHAYYFQAPPVIGTSEVGFGSQARCIHGWLQNRTQFPAGTIDGFWTQWDCRVDNPNSRFLFVNGVDYWEAGPYAPNTGHNTGPSQSTWVLMTTAWRTVSGTCLAESILRNDPPPPLAGGIPEI